MVEYQQTSIQQARRSFGVSHSVNFIFTQFARAFFKLQTFDFFSKIFRDFNSFNSLWISFQIFGPRYLIDFNPHETVLVPRLHFFSIEDYHFYLPLLISFCKVYIFQSWGHPESTYPRQRQFLAPSLLVRFPLLSVNPPPPPKKKA